MKRLCSEMDCDKQVHGLGYCVRHYKQVYRHGKTFKTIYEHRPAVIVGDIAYIPVGMKGAMAIVDKEFATLDRYKWCSTPSYPKAFVNKKLIAMHRLIMPDKPNMEIDHINRDKLDNRKANLRYATHQQNTWNMSTQKNKHGFRGVRKAAGTKSFHATIGYNNNVLYLGSYKTAKEAAIAYDNMASELFGEYAVLNFKEKTNE